MEITKGKWEATRFATVQVSASEILTICKIYGLGEKADNHAILIADAGNTYQATNKLPSELAEANKELLQALTRLYDAIDSCVELTPELLHTCMKLIHKNSKNA